MTIKATSTVDVQINLSMDLATARWLKAVLQNPLDGLSPEDEFSEERSRRISVFAALKDQTDNHA